MESVMFYTYPSCTSCRKTKKWLVKQEVNFNERHLFRETPTYEEMLELLSMTTEGIDEILAKRSQEYKNLDVDVESMTLSEVVHLLMEQPRLLRRPILTDGKKLVVGYNESALKNLVKKQKKVSSMVG
ncbi:Spx/MgsR family RNA polymerase-binding regulatory protein [Priestia flexa]|jgi:regulatory protein spx|uniref:Transcriptional regulator Spx n=1 Tax=Priestia flexa TaxID=86664 RepID=A0A8I1SKB6_9BACI|nr:Spx/MgsR family RNA polymerase-binding regulatory protein [Priestia flexa]MBN8250397.1 transcriptional regulator Spx [Priestia flexa]MBN8432781.1 transcriptional regulator Spx [Priestia flexa]MCA0965233.1 Spx/MgsR family RNA polymerase-binding regulatory protein [Priestia flexa]RIV09804.1 Spx/MgsR family RNA polymerase-binding regulatory protein [Priestia flexa]UIR29300.1 Spx/MgsR family RNA polymerase-binding regulatory protein [Priestia flexa]